MKLTPENKKRIDEMTYEELLQIWSFSPIGEAWTEGETGSYFATRMQQLRDEPGGYERHVSASKRIGWG